MKRKMRFLSVLLVMTMLMSVLPVLNVMAANPYLPLWEHLPDGEPKVFEDPDNPGKYRAYIYGSHDVRQTSYCGPDIRAWSAPVEDLTNWRDEGSVFKYYIDGQWDVFYAPDIVEVIRKDGKKEYYLYPHSRGANRIAMVCKSDSPVGPFEPINMTADGRRTVPGSILGFDPAVWIEYITDPSDPDYEIGFRAYAYWGFAGSNEKSWACELDQNTMYSVRPGTQAIQYFMPCSSRYGVINDPEGTTYPYIYPDEDLTAFNFFEASSIRKIGNKYIMLYSGYSGPDYGLGSTNSALRYCYGDTPLGPWRSGGVLVDSRAPVLNRDGSGLQTTYSGHNTHGSLLEINGNWYCFYHRAPRGFSSARQPMVAPVKITWDEKPVSEGGKVVIRAFDPYSEDNTWTAKDSKGNEYTGAEVTSEGFEVFGLDPYKYYSAGYACYLSNTNTQQDSYDIWDNSMPITGIQNGHIIGYKYFGFGGLSADLAAKYGLKPFEGTKPGNNTKFNLFLTPRTSNSFKINVWMDGPWDNDAWKGKKIGEIVVPANSEQVLTKFSVDVSQFVDNADKKHAIFLVAEGGSGNLFDLTGLGFSSDTKAIEYIAPPAISIEVDGVPLELPTRPIASTNANGICDYDLYGVTYKRPAGSPEIPVVTASSNDENVEITISQPTSPNGSAVVRFNKDGVVKTYRIALVTEGSELIENGGFENGIYPWEPHDSAKIEVIEDPEKPGSHILYVSQRGATGAGVQQYLTGKVEPGKTYKVSAKVKYVAEKAPATRQFFMSFQDGDWQTITNMAGATIRKGEWGTIEGTYTIDPTVKDGAYATLENPRIFIETSWTQQQDPDNDLMDFYVDDVSIIEVVNVDDEIPVSGVTLDTNTLNLVEGNSAQLTAKVTPDNATNKKVTWKSSNTNVATVDNTGKVTAVSKGTAIITVTTEEGGYTATCTVNVRGESSGTKGYVINTTFSLDKLVGNKMLAANVNVENVDGNNDSVLAIVALYDANDRMINVSYISKVIAQGKTEILNAGFLLPNDITGHCVKVFVWDGESLDSTKMQPLSSVVVLQ